MGKMILNLGCIQCNINYKSSPKPTYLKNSLLMRIVETPKKYISHGEIKLLTWKVRTSSVKYFSWLLSCLICSIYHRVHRVQTQRLMLKQ